MKTYNIEITGKSIYDIIDALEDCKRWIEQGFASVSHSNEEGGYSYDSSGEYEQ